jgi:Xylose isomerase-like TIM barrel.
MMKRRQFLQTSSLAALSFSMPFPRIPDFLKEYSMGIVIHSYGMRYGGRVKSEDFPPFENAVDLMRHCHQIGAGGVQTTVGAWGFDFSKTVREEREKLGLYLEGSISLPKEKTDLDRFEQEIKDAKNAGATVLRTVCLNGRRYENFESNDQFKDFKKKALISLQLAEAIVKKHQVKLAVENHKDWTSEELVEILKNLSSEWVGATVDFGNNVSLLENPNQVIENLAPFAFSTHVKDMGVQEYEEGFLLSEVPLGEGIVDLKKGMDLCRKFNPDIQFSLEMITRDPLKIPCLTDKYWETFESVSGSELSRHLSFVRKESYPGSLPQVSGLSDQQKLQVEEENVQKCLNYSKSNLLT